MSEFVRGHQIFMHQEGHYESLLWQNIEKNVCDVIGKKIFDPSEPLRFDDFHYLPSQSRSTRFDLVHGHSRYQAEPGLVQSLNSKSNLPLGVVETDILSFAYSPNPILCILVGGMGSGKSTSIKYLRTHYLQKKTVVLCDLDSSLHVSNLSFENFQDIDIVSVLVQNLSAELNQLISPEEEYKELWTWGLSNDGRNHPAQFILSDAQNTLRHHLGDDWRCESTDAISIRKECIKKLNQDHIANLTYQALRIDYYLTCRCKNDRSCFILVIDNVDPLPPRIQFLILDLSSRLQTSARCKVLLSMRPLTYSSNFQSAHKTLEVIEHIGPSVIDLIEHRIRDSFLKANIPKLEVRLHEDGHEEKVIKQDEAKEWVKCVLSTLKLIRRNFSPPGEPNARTFVDGICGNSLRSGLILAPKIFGSSVIPIIGTLDRKAAQQNLPVRDHDIIRAILEGWHCHFEASRGRVTDNLFDLGSYSTSRSCTCKVRLLKKLVESNNGVVTLGELRTHLSCFGYDDGIILDSVNSIIAQTKRLAWSDSVSFYKELDGSQSTKIKVSKAGQFYVNYAMFNLAYVQAVHLDVLLPREDTLEHDPRNFADRVRSLELFVRYLNKQDQEEVLRIMYNNAAADYNSVYNGSLFSIEMIISLARQVRKVGTAILVNKRNHDRRDEINQAIVRWDDLVSTVKMSSIELIRKLANAGC